MKMTKFPSLCGNLLKLQHSVYLKKSCFGGWQLRNLTLMGGCCLNKKIENNALISFNGLEQIEALKSISRKNNKISVVEEKDVELVEFLKKDDDVIYPYASPMDKFKTIMVEDAKATFNRFYKFLTNVELGKLEVEFFPRDTDILIIGGGVMGLLVSFFIRTTFPYGPKVTVIDKKTDFPPVGTNLSQGMVTHQLFNEEEEIAIIKYGIEFFSSFPRKTEVDGNPKLKIHFDPLGSLVLADVTNADKVLKKNETLKLHGIHNKILKRETLKEKFPWLNLDDVLFGSLGMSQEGTIDPWAFLYGIKSKCINTGVEFLNAEVIEFGYENEDIRRAVCKLPNGSYNSISFAYCVVAGGIESLNIVDLFNKSSTFNLGLNLPLDERMRYEYCFYSPNGPGLNTPIVIDSEGTYFRREGLTGHYITGLSSIENYDQVENSPFQVFENKIKPFLMKRVPQLNEVHLCSGWIEPFDVCYANRVGITGPHPETNRIVFALGFSHFGLLLLPGLARAVTEFILYDTYQTIDFTPFHIENLWRKQHLEADRKRRELLEQQQRLAISK